MSKRFYSFNGLKMGEGKKGRSSKLVTLIRAVMKSDKLMYLENGSRWLLVASGDIRGNVKLTSRIVTALSCVMLMAVSARTSFVVPFTEIPFTLQTLALAMIVLLLRKDAWKSILTYLTLGFAGLPVFAYGGGLQYVVSPTTGYLIGFLMGSLLGYLVGSGGGILRFILTSLGVVATVYFFGWLWLSTFYIIMTGLGDVLNSMYMAFLHGVVPFIVWDFMKALIASLISYEIYKLRGKLKVLTSITGSLLR